MSTESDLLPDWKNLFVGREDELRVLTTAWQTAKSRTPMAVAVVADTGFGKTRLVHEFYRWLSAHEDPDSGYWPPALGVTGANLEVNPRPEECGANAAAMPFLWWGLRLASNEERNAMPVSALSAGAQSLGPHLGSLQRALREEERRRILRSGGIDFGGDVGMEVAAHGAQTIADVALPGFGLVRTLYKQIRTYRDVKVEQQQEKLKNVSPLFEGQRQQADLIETLIEDLRHVVLAPPQDLQPVPAVVFIDDAHHASRDPSILAFLDTLLRIALKESWPLLLVTNSWEHSWRADPPGDLRRTLEMHFGPTLRWVQLSRSADLGPIVDTALPGLTSAQRAAMLQKAEGNPEYLDAMIHLLRQSPRWFVDRRTDRALNSDGESRLADVSFADVSRQRLQAAAPLVRRCLSVAAGVGQRFTTALVARAGALLELENFPDGLAAAEMNPGFIALTRETGEFRQKAYLEAALEDSGNFFDNEQITLALAQAARELDLPHTPDADREELLTEQFNLLCNSPLSSDRKQAYDALGTLVKLRMDLLDFRGSIGLARIWLEALQEARFQLNPADCETVDTVAECLQHWGQDADAVALRLQMLEQIRALHSAEPTAAHLSDLRVELTNVASAMEATQGPAAAQTYWGEALTAAMSLYDLDASPGNRTDLAYSLMDMARNQLEAGDPLAAKPFLETSISIQRALFDELPGPGRQLALANSLRRLGEVLLRSDDQDEAAQQFEEALALISALEEGVEGKQETCIAFLLDVGRQYAGLDQFETARSLFEEAKRRLDLLDADHASPDLVMFKTCFGMLYGLHVIEPQSGEEAAAPFYAESLAQARLMANRINTYDTQRLLAVLLMAYAVSLRNSERTGQARDLAREAVAVLRELDALASTARSRLLLAHSLSLLATLTYQQEGPGPAAANFRECVELLRPLLEAGQVPPSELRRALTACADNQRELKNRAAAEQVYEEALVVAQSMRKLEPSPENLWEEMMLTDRLRQLFLRRMKLRSWWRCTRDVLRLRHRLVSELVNQGMSLREIRSAMQTGQHLPSGVDSNSA